MSCRDEILECVDEVLRRKNATEFTIEDIIDCMLKKGTAYTESTIRTHIASRMCANAPDHHGTTYRDLERTNRGTYRLKGEPPPAETSTDLPEDRESAPFSTPFQTESRDIRTVDPDRLSAEFRAYVQRLPAAALVASERTSFESWFRAELGIVLMRLGFRREELRYNFNYPTEKHRRKKADICLTADKPIVFELKTFSVGADANKLHQFPKQLRLLQEHVEDGYFLQGISFATFFGYSDTRLQTIIKNLFPDSTEWRISGPHQMLYQHPLVFMVASTTARKA